MFMTIYSYQVQLHSQKKLITHFFHHSRYTEGEGGATSFTSFSPTVTLGDFGSLDGRYAKYLNETGAFSAYAVDGIENIEQLTDGRVLQADLTKPLLQSERFRALVLDSGNEYFAGDGGDGGLDGKFDYILCLEV